MRVKRSVASRQKHNKIRKLTKGMQRSRRGSIRLGNQAVIKALQYAYRDRRNRKRDMRRLWITRISAAAHKNNTNYAKLMNQLSTANIAIDRKMLAELAANNPKVFTKIIEEANKKQ